MSAPDPLRFDALVAGAGPAGCAAALVLRQAGLRVALIDDTADAERLRVGESLPAAAARLLRRLGIAGLADLLAPAEFAPCAANASAWGADTWSFQDAIANPEGPGWHLLRHRFDAALRARAERAGVTRLRGRVQAIRHAAAPGRDGFDLALADRDGDATGAIPLAADWVIDATGRAAAFARAFGATRERPDTQMAVVGWLVPQPGDTDATTRIKSAPDGWWYSARLPDGRRVVARHGLPETVAAAVRSPADHTAALNASGLLPWPVPPTAWLGRLCAVDAGMARTVPAAAPGWLAIGDAAIGFDPLASQGLFFALYSGVRAAETVLGARAAPADTDAWLARYCGKIDDVFTATDRSRRYHYASESRFAAEPYWRSRFAAAATGDAIPPTMKT